MQFLDGVLFEQGGPYLHVQLARLYNVNMLQWLALSQKSLSLLDKLGRNRVAQLLKHRSRQALHIMGFRKEIQRVNHELRKLLKARVIIGLHQGYQCFVKHVKRPTFDYRQLQQSGVALTLDCCGPCTF